MYANLSRKMQTLSCEYHRQCRAIYHMSDAYFNRILLAQSCPLPDRPPCFSTFNQPKKNHYFCFRLFRFLLTILGVALTTPFFFGILFERYFTVIKLIIIQFACPSPFDFGQLTNSSTDSFFMLI